MRYVAAYLLAALGGNAKPSAADVKNILSSVGIDAEEDKLNKVIAELEGKSLEEVIADGQEKLASVPSGGVAAAAGGAPAAAGGAAPAAAAAAAPEPEPEEEEEDMGFDLFG